MSLDCSADFEFVAAAMAHKTHKTIELKTLRFGPWRERWGALRLDFKVQDLRVKVWGLRANGLTCLGKETQVFKKITLNRKS